MNPFEMTYNSPPIFTFFAVVLYSIIKRLCYSNEEEEEDDGLVEGLDEYYEALKKKDKVIVIGQEEYFKKEYQVKSYKDESFDKLLNSKDEDSISCFQGCATYRLLDNLLYEQAFQYEPPKLQHDGKIRREGVVIITTDETEEAFDMRINDERQ